MPHVLGVNDDGAGFGVKGENTTPASILHLHEAGVVGTSQGGVGVFGTSGDIASLGVFGSADIGVQGVSPDGTGVSGHSGTGHGVTGDSQTGNGVTGFSNSGNGVFGQGKNGVHGQSLSASDSGVWGENTQKGYGVSGSTNSDFVLGPGVTAGVWGNNAGSGAGVKGISQGGDGVVGFSHSSAHAGVSSVNDSGGFGVYAKANTAGYFESTGGWAIQAVNAHDNDCINATANSAGHAAVSGTNTGGGFGVWAKAKTAGHFEGDVEVTGDIRLLGGDCAEDFDIGAVAEVDPGTVMVLDGNGALRPNEQEYDKKVAGVISGAGDYRPGMILGRCESTQRRMPLALVGKVYCKVDAQYGPIEVGDLLTTSPTPGHAMRAADPLKAFGAVIGKALRPLKSEQGLIPILVALQ
jgi:hypothetical protein